MRRNKSKHRRDSGKHIVKTPAERNLYNEKVKHTESEGVTREQLPNKSSTLSLLSAYASSHNAGIPDRTPIKSPLVIERGKLIKTIFTITAAVLTIFVIFGGAIFWFANFKNKVEYNEKQIDKLQTSTKELYTKQGDFNTRIANLEQWKNIVDNDLKVIKEDIKKGVPNEQIEVRLSELEEWVFKRKVKE